MAVYNYEGEEINIKIVYYGPGLSGKTTNLEHIYSKLPRDNKGKMVSMKTRTDRTLFFDFLPIEVGGINGMSIRFLLYTVPGQVYYNATRKLVLKGVDAVVFVADSSPDRMQDNKESLKNLEENLNDIGLTLREVPWVIQYNKRDVPDCIEREVMERELNFHKVPSFEAIATTGRGVYGTFEGIGGLVIGKMQKDLKGVKKSSGPQKKPSEKQINFEVVAKGKSGIRDSEADESESLYHAEEREEEHESVSEFVNSVLIEQGENEESIDMGATREGYEDYGHLVELEDGEERAEKATTANMEIISDPLEKFSGKPVSGVQPVSAGSESTGVQVAEEKVIQVPVTIAKEDLEKDVPIKVILEIKVDSH